MLFLCCFLRGLTHRKIMFCFLIYLVIWKVDRMGFARTHAHTHTCTRREERGINPPSLCTPQCLTAEVLVLHTSKIKLFSSADIKCNRLEGGSSKASQTTFYLAQDQSCIWQIHQPALIHFNKTHIRSTVGCEFHLAYRRCSYRSLLFGL